MADLMALKAGVSKIISGEIEPFGIETFTSNREARTGLERKEKSALKR
jgi:hypothetical protein